MANIFDYIDVYGEKSFEEMPFGDVDNAILSQLVYIKFSSVVQFNSNVIKLSDAWRIFSSIYTKEKLKEENSKYIKKVEMFEKLASSSRFSDVGLLYFFELTEKEEQKQFAAIHYIIEDGVHFVAFRGTDDTIVGYEEDAQMAYNFPISSQIEAALYINSTCNDKNKYIVGGHSKGGNLALYASAFCESKIQNSIIKVYNNDGPGFPEKVLEDERYKKVLPIVETIVPESSVVGMLLSHGEKFTIVKSNKIGISQHDMFSWQIKDNEFDTIKDVSLTSKLIGETLQNCVETMDKEQMEDFFTEVFDVFDNSGIESVNELKLKRISNIANIIKFVDSADGIDKGIITSTVDAVLNQAVKAVIPNELVNKDELASIDFVNLLKDKVAKIRRDKESEKQTEQKVIENE